MFALLTHLAPLWCLETGNGVRSCFCYVFTIERETCDLVKFFKKNELKIMKNSKKIITVSIFNGQGIFMHQYLVN